MKDKEALLKLIRYWLFGTFVIVFAAVTIYAGLWVGTAIFSQPNYWIIIVSAAVLCIGGYFGYKAYLDQQK